MSDEIKDAEGAVIPKEGEEVTPSSDPLDAIVDEGDRAEAKKLRAINARHSDKEDEEEEEDEEVEENTSNYATKDDLKVMATNEAKKLVAPEVLAAWDELTKIPLGGYNGMDSGAIAVNMQSRYMLYQAQNPDAPDVTKELTSSPNTPPSGGPAPKDKVSKPLPGFKESAQPADWYPEGKA